MRFYVLVSNYLGAFERCLSTLPLDNTFVVINTIHTDIESKLEDICKDNGVPYKVTLSNGTPGKGKNALMQAFLDNSDDYMVMIDGDDFLTPYGVKYFENIQHKPDMLCTYGDIKCFDADLVLKQLTDDPSIHSVDNSLWEHYPDDTDGVIMPEDITTHIMRDPRFPYEEAITIGYDYSDFHDYMKTFADKGTGLLRLLFWSRKAAQHANYNETLFIGDDHIQYFKLKRLAYEGELDMQVTDHDDKPLYMYVIDNENSPGVCFENHFGDMRWIRPLLDELESETYPEYKLPFTKK